MIRRNLFICVSILVVVFLFGTVLTGFAGVLEDIKEKGIQKYFEENYNKWMEKTTN